MMSSQGSCAFCLLVAASIFTSYYCYACPHGEVRLTGGCPNRTEGRVEICVNETWGTVCDDFWDDMDAKVVCNQLGYESNATAFSRAVHGISNGSIFLDTVECVGNESLLLDCPSRPLGTHDCRNFEDASVACFQDGCTEGDVRLAGGNFYEGRVEVCQDGLWGTVCDDLWGEEDAFVVCGQLGLLSEGAVAADFGPGCGPIFYDNVECTRKEKRLEECHRANFGDCYHHQDAGVRCALSDVSFLPYGLEIGDNSTSDGSLGPFDLPTPVVYYLKKEYQIFVSVSGEIAFQNPMETSNSPLIAPNWRVNYPGTTLYARVVEDSSALELVRNTMMDGNTAIFDYQPSLALIATWYRSESENATLQVVVSTDGRASFMAFLFNDGHGVSILEETDILTFVAGDVLTGSRNHNYIYANDIINLKTLRTVLNSFRIDGHCITLDSPNRVCSLNSYAVNCQEAFNASTCRCYNESSELEMAHAQDDNEPSRVNSTVELMGNETEVETNITTPETESCETTTISCVSGSVASPCIPPGALNTNYSGCYPTLLPCYFVENCLSETELTDCSSSGLTVFGEGVGDIRGGRDDDNALGPIIIDIPIMYFNTRRYKFYVSTNCLLSFENPYDTYMLCGALPCAPEAIIAPIWTDLDFRFSGVLFYRTSQDPTILNQIASTIGDVNPALSDYQPTQAVIVTWFEARAHYDDDDPTLGEYRGTIQLVVSTDGTNSFASFIYENPASIQNVTKLGNMGDEGGVIGFDGERTSGADYGKLLTMENPLQTVNSFRIDGECVTTILPGQACSLEARTAMCNNFAATTCECDPGFEYDKTSCVDINECTLEPRECDVNANCINSIGAFNCTCKEGYAGDGNNCKDVNECSQGICGNFSQCINTEGNYTCICNLGYRLVGRNQCVALGLTAVYIGLIATGGFIVATILCGILVAICCLVRRRRQKAKEALLRSKALGNEYSTVAKLMRMRVQSSFNLHVGKSLIVNSCNLELGKTLGQGEFGIVYRGSLKRGYRDNSLETVAVKTLKGFMQKEHVTEMLKECEKMKEFDHPNVLALKGVCLDGGPAPFIVMQYMANGSLLAYLKENRQSLVLDPNITDPDDITETQKKLLDICLQVGKGMEYLASKRFIHRDLAARNCMIDSGFVIKVADFGLSESLGGNKEYFRQKGDDTVKLPIKWLAIESINDGIFSEKTDVWAYGVTCWEVFSGGKTPYPGMHPRDLSRQLENGYRMEKPLSAACTDQLYDVVLKCWEAESKQRPTFSEIVAMYTELLTSVADYFTLGANMATIDEETEHELSHHQDAPAHDELLFSQHHGSSDEFLSPQHHGSSDGLLASQRNGSLADLYTAEDNALALPPEPTAYLSDFADFIGSVTNTFTIEANNWTASEFL